MPREVSDMGRPETNRQAGRRGEDATYPIGEVARLSGVTERTLRHYESKGLLVPARRENGYRAYAPADLAGLDAIRRTLDGSEADVRAALAAQIDALLARRGQIDSLIANARAALAEEEGGVQMGDKARFEALRRAAIEENERTYGAEVRERYGDEAMDASNVALEAMDEDEWQDLEALGKAILKQLACAMATGDPKGTESAKLARMHAAWIRGYWGEGRYTPEAHRMLVRSHVEDARFRAYYDDRLGEGATAFLVEAVCANVA